MSTGSVRPDVQLLATAMEHKLRDRDAEHGDSYKQSSITYLMDRLHQEVKEADQAFAHCNPVALKAECVDIANFAMMIHGNLTRGDNG